MKSLSSFIFFLPIILFIGVLLFNFELLSQAQTLNIPFLFSADVPVFLWFSIFFILYILGLWATFKFSNFFSGLKNNKLGGEINDLKAELYDKQGSLITDIKKEFEKTVAEYKEEASKDRKTYKTETDKILNNLQFEVTTLGEKISDFQSDLKKNK